MTPQERAAAFIKSTFPLHLREDGEPCDGDIEDVVAHDKETRRAALLEARQASEQVTLQSVRAEIRWREKHASEEVDGIAKSERAECHLRSLGLAIMDAIDRLAQEG